MNLLRSATILFSATVLLVASQGCKNQSNNTGSTTTDTTTAAKVNVPDFNADSAYIFVDKQVSFGPRTPGSAAQQQCATWMQLKLKDVCDTVYRQDAQVVGGDGKKLPCINLIGVIHPKATKRILLLTHWDSRPWADMDTKDQDKPILAADDGGSGVGVLLEVAREIKTHTLPENIGIDILFTDVEDYGRTAWGDDSYCLGTQYWANHPHVPGYKADYGILLDMVGARGAQFPMEGLSTQFAGSVQQMVWQEASKAGYSSYFPFTQAVEITDDHVPVNKITNIPTIDIINLNTNAQGSPFAAHWHTHQDNMSIIDKNTLKAVGQTLLQVIYDAGQPS
jgi:glutaminyl-peptide cyclotransferase